MGRAYVLPLAVFVAGMCGGFALWLSGLDVAWQWWLYDNYHHGFNQYMRFLGEVGVGRTKVVLCALAAVLWEVGRRRAHGGEQEAFSRVAARMVGGAVEQVFLWAALQRRWASLWHGIGRGPRMLMAAVSILAFSGIAQIILKGLVGRPRPKEVFWNGVDPYDMRPFDSSVGFWSFPSGHTVSVCAIGVWLMLAFPRWRYEIGIVMVVLSVSRFLSVTPHYVGDVVAGAGVGAAVALFFAALMRDAGGFGKERAKAHGRD